VPLNGAASRVPDPIIRSWRNHRVIRRARSTHTRFRALLQVVSTPSISVMRAVHMQQRCTRCFRASALVSRWLNRVSTSLPIRRSALRRCSAPQYLTKSPSLLFPYSIPSLEASRNIYRKALFERESPLPRVHAMCTSLLYRLPELATRKVCGARLHAAACSATADLRQSIPFLVLGCCTQLHAAQQQICDKVFHSWYWAAARMRARGDADTHAPLRYGHVCSRRARC